MKEKELNLKLIEKFPELKLKYEDEVNWQEGDDTGSHVIYGDVFVPFIKEMLNKKNNEKLNEIFDFIEALLNMNDDYIEDVLSVSVIESIIYNDINLIKKHAQKKTLKVIKKFIAHDNENKKPI